MKYWLLTSLVAAVCLAVGAAATAVAPGERPPVAPTDRVGRPRTAAPTARPPAAPARRPGTRGRPRGTSSGRGFDALTIAGLCRRARTVRPARTWPPCSTRPRNCTAPPTRRTRTRIPPGSRNRRGGPRHRPRDVALPGRQRRAKRTITPPPVTVMPPPPGEREGPRPPRPGDREAAPPPPPGSGRPSRRARATVGTAAPAPWRPRTAAPPVGGPPAPLDPQTAAKEMIRQRIGGHLEKAGDDAKGPGKAILNAAHKALDEAKEAQKDGDFVKAVGLARAADVWSHAAEHLEHADEPAGPDRPPLRPPATSPTRTRAPPRPPSDD